MLGGPVNDLRRGSADEAMGGADGSLRDRLPARQDARLPSNFMAVAVRTSMAGSGGGQCRTSAAGRKDSQLTCSCNETSDCR